MRLFVLVLIVFVSRELRDQVRFLLRAFCLGHACDPFVWEGYLL